MQRLSCFSCVGHAAIGHYAATCAAGSQGGTLDHNGCPPALVPQVGLMVSSDLLGKNSQLCSATLVSNNHVLTSAHCLFDNKISLHHFVVYMGASSPRPCYDDKHWGMVSSCKYPASFSPGTSATSTTDYAVCQLAQTSTIPPAHVGGSAGRYGTSDFSLTGVVAYPGGKVGNDEPYGWVPYFEQCITEFDDNLTALVRTADKGDPHYPCSYSSGMSGGPLFATGNGADTWELSSLHGQDRFIIGVLEGYDPGNGGALTAVELEAAKGAAAAATIKGWI